MGIRHPTASLLPDHPTGQITRPCSSTLPHLHPLAVPPLARSSHSYPYPSYPYPPTPFSLPPRDPLALCSWPALRLRTHRPHAATMREILPLVCPRADHTAAVGVLELRTRPL